MLMSKDKFKKLHDDANKLAGELGTLAERTDDKGLAKAYDKSCQTLDAVEDIGERMGYLNNETLECK